MVKDSVVLEVCVDSLESALTAERGGAQRIELCSDLDVGGTTPSLGLIAIARKRVGIKLHIMIRPRGGDFCYTDEEFEVMLRDVEAVKEAGADGIVFGMLAQDCKVDLPRSRKVIEDARPLSVTFHRAFDLTRDLNEALQDVIAIGADRVLTSGGAQTAEAGMEVIANLVAAAGDSLILMAGSGISETNAGRIVAETGVREIHASLRERVASPMMAAKAPIHFSALPGNEYHRNRVSEERVRRVLAALNSGQR